MGTLARSCGAITPAPSEHSIQGITSKPRMPERHAYKTPTGCLSAAVRRIMLGPFLLSLALSTVAAQNTSYNPVAPPDTLAVSYPGGNVGVGDTITVGVYTIDVPNSAHGFDWNTNMSVRVPNGTHVVLGAVFTGCGWFSTIDAAASRPNNFTTPDGLTNQTGVYTFIWNQTYGSVANLTNSSSGPSTCDLKQPVMYQSWILDANVTVVAEHVPSPTQTQTTFTLSPEPTGKLWVPNSAPSSVSFSITLLLGSGILALLQV